MPDEDTWPLDLSKEVLNYDEDFCMEIIRCIEQDIEAAKNLSGLHLKMKMQVSGLSQAEVISREVSELEYKKQLCLDRLEVIRK